MVSRLFGSQGDIQVFGAASQIPTGNIPPNKIAAVAGTDFSSQFVSVVLSSGTTSGSIVVPLTQNFNESQPKVFTFTITSVVRLPVQGEFQELLVLNFDYSCNGLSWFNFS